MGAQLTSLYPMSVLIHAQGLNITVLSYAGELQYGLLSTPEIAPDVQHLADLIAEEFRGIQAAAKKKDAKKPAASTRTKASLDGKPVQKKSRRKKTARTRATGKNQ